MAAVTWNDTNLAYAGVQRVYIKQYWADDWSLQSNIWCSQMSWALLPSIPVAHLSLEYGEILPHGSTVWATQAKLDIAGWYVKVEVDAADGTLVWHGFIDETIDEQGGVTANGAGVASGLQRWVAFGMVQVLAHAYFTRSRWWDEPNTTARWSGSAIDFNADGKPNRTESAIGDAASHNFSTFLFQPTAPQNLYGSSAPWSAAAYWTSRSILAYIENYVVPLDNADLPEIRFEFSNLSAVSNSDQPSIQAEGRSVLDVFNELVNSNKLLQASAAVAEDMDGEYVLITIHSLADSAIDLGNGFTHPANTTTLSVVTWAAHDTNVLIQDSLSRRAVQVITKGSKRQSMCTVQVGQSHEPYHGLVEAFTASQADAYNTAASGEAGYSSMSDDEKKQANQRVRAKAILADVYKTFTLNPKWWFDIGGTLLFKNEDGSRYHPYWSSLRIGDSIPLKEVFDYSQAVMISSGPTPILSFHDDHITKQRKPFVVFERPTETMQYIDCEKMANGSDPVFSCYIGLSKDDQAVSLDVTGGYQHAIATTRFVALPVDDEAYGDWDYFDSYFTITLQEDRFAESRYPADDDLPTVDVVRRKIIYAGDAYQQVYCAPDTVCDVKNDGSLQKVHDGQEVPDFKNDVAELSQLAIAAHTWMETPRRILRLISARPSATAAVGQLVTTLNADTSQSTTINTVISEIKLSMQRGAGLPINTAQFEFSTAMGELDPLQFFPKQKRVV